MNRLFKLNRFFSNTSSKIKFEYFNNNCLVTLNHDQALNALDLDITKDFRTELQKWESNNCFPKILILGSNHGSKAFCAGGDVKAIVKLKDDNQPLEKLIEFFKDEYTIQYQLANLESKGVTSIAIWDGIVMGGGVGLSLRASYRLATEKTVFAMPENIIGLFPDIGFSFNAQRMSKGLGRGLMLGGLRLMAEETVYSSLATGLVKSDSIPDLKQEILKINETNKENQKSEIEKILSMFTDKNTLDQNRAKFEAKMHDLERGLSGSTLDECLDNSVKYRGNTVISTIHKNIVVSSPLSLKVTWELLNRRCKSLKEAYVRDYDLVKYFLEKPDFYSGVKTLLIDKSKEVPTWTYKSIKDISENEINSILNGNETKYKNKLII